MLIETYELRILQLTTAEERLKALSNPGEPKVNRTDNYLRIGQSVLVRMTIIVLILFLVRLLFNLYRYLTRIAAAYDSKADAIDLVSYDPEKLAKLVDAFSTEQFDFGKTPTGPVDQATEIIRAINGLQRQGKA